MDWCAVHHREDDAHHLDGAALVAASGRIHQADLREGVTWWGAGAGAGAGAGVGAGEGAGEGAGARAGAGEGARAEAELELGPGLGLDASCSWRTASSQQS